MNKHKMIIWGRELEMGVTYDCYSEEAVLDSQKEALAAFLAAEQAIEDALEPVKKYCLSCNAAEIGTTMIDNIFKYVAPKYLYIPRNENKHVVAIMCNYKFDSENGIAVVFENEKFGRAGKQDIIL